MRNFINKYKAEILILLGAIISICSTLMAEGMDGVVPSIIIAIVAILIEVLKNGITEQSITLLANAIKIMIEELGDIKVKDDKEENVVATSRVVKTELTIEDIKKRLIEK